MMNLERLSEYKWLLPIGSVPGMRVPGIVYGDEPLVRSLKKEGSLKQLAQSATLPGAERAALAMPDIHFGYGFPIGGVLATRCSDGVISPGGVGFDINCGVRLVAMPLERGDVRSSIETLIRKMFAKIPCGVGSRGRIKLAGKELKKVVRDGSRWAVENGYGDLEDLTMTEAGGRLPKADPGMIGTHAYERGKDQIGTLGSGNHFIEIQYVETIYKPAVANAFGLRLNQVTVMIHSGSRGLGHQVCTDFLKVMRGAVTKYNINIPDRQLACAPFRSKEGRAYLSALQGAANFAWANRQCLMHEVRAVFHEVFGSQCRMTDMPLVYDVAHNIVKIETHNSGGKNIELAVHRKGATRAWGPGRREVPEKYRAWGQPVLIPGDMGTASYVLVGTEQAMKETFGSACHGAGRILSRKAARRAAKGRSITRELYDRGITVMSAGRSTIAEEMPDAYKKIDDVVRIVAGAGIAEPVARLKPMGVVKG